MLRLTAVLFAVGALSCAGPSPSSNAYAFCADLAGKVCDQQISCKQRASSHRGECVDDLRLNQCGVRANEGDRNLFKLNEKLTKRCLADVKSTGCTREGVALVGGCVAAIEPAIATGGKCETDSNCRDINDRCIGVGCDRTCQKAGNAGEPCRPGGTPGTGTCNGGLSCGAEGKCTRGGGTGADCSFALPCDPNNFCDNATSKCAALPPAGQPCRFATPSCDEASFCGGLMCTARGGAGAVCLTANQCTVGLNCRGGTCQAPVAEGGACTSSFDCVSGTLCDDVALTCQKLKRVFYEEACSSTALCPGGLTCRNLKPGTGGAAGSCGIPVAGDSCFTSNSCPPGTECTGASASMAGSCTATASGMSCNLDKDCVEGEACHQTDRKCGTRTGVGGNCAQLSCVATAVCEPRGAARVCVEPADLNATCSSDMVQAVPCRQPLLCARTSCISVGRRGEACIGGLTGKCFSGACVEGVCADPRPGGAVCKQDTDCQSLACERGICVQACK